MNTLLHIPSPQPIDDLDGWLSAFTQRTMLFELLALAVCVVLSLTLATALRRAFGARDQRSIWFGNRVVNGVLFPLILLCLAFVARAILIHWVAVALFKVAIPVLVALVVIRLGVKVLRVAFEQARWSRLLEQTISWVAWLTMVLWVSGLLTVVLNELDQITWKVGGTTLSVRTLIEGMLTASVVLVITLWISAALETRLLRSATGGELSLRMAVSNATRALLIFLGLMLALSAVGIDLTALSVLGGAIGVGIGLGLQRLTANYISGFVILAERSMRIGDSVRVDNFEGTITHINARYTVVRSATGRESIVPNELLITSRVENLSLADSNLYQTTVVTVASNSDVNHVIALMVQAALAQQRVLRNPAPSAYLSAFVPDGLEMTLGYWLEDAVNGQMNLRSDINRAVLAALREHKIDISMPQRVLYAVSNGGAPARAATPDRSPVSQT